MPSIVRPRRAALARVALLLAAAATPAFGTAQNANRARKKPRPRQPAAPAPAPTTYAGHPAVPAFAADAAARHGLDAAWIEAHLAQARRIESVRGAVMPPPAGTAKDWAAYRARFVEPRRIAAGLAFRREHEATLAQAGQRWGVPAEIVAAIIGVETFYGRMTGSYRTLDALATLAFDFPPGRRDRSAFFRGELEEFFVLCAHQRVDPQQPTGSYAGAMGLPQFMPGSVNRLALDFDGDGRIDLLRSPSDAIGSVAHYLAAHGWEAGLPTHYAVAVPVDAGDRAALLAPDIVPTFSAAEFAARGALLDDAGRAHAGPLALVELQNGALAPSYVAATRNFWVITRYNWSAYYAMAVIDLAQALRTPA